MQRPLQPSSQQAYSRFNLFAVLLIFVFVLQACGVARTGTDRSSTPTSPRSVDKEDARMLQSGVASWYGSKFHGKATANGEMYNMNDHTAAHRTLPFNTVVMVENMDNGKSVIVRINDRGPYVGNRVIDLSRRAARDIDMEDSGTANVQIYLLEEGDRPVSGSVTNQETFTIQLASYNRESQAKNFASGINGSRVERTNASGRTVYRVYYGKFDTASEARQALSGLSGQGLEGFVKQAEN